MYQERKTDSDKRNTVQRVGYMGKEMGFFLVCNGIGELEGKERYH